ncbi:hypothetical protein [Clostridium sp. 'deep sea']|nr:hypothetical protein [Clostridium sp. 'deep sea']
MKYLINSSKKVCGFWDCGDLLPPKFLGVCDIRCWVFFPGND